MNPTEAPRPKPTKPPAGSRRSPGLGREDRQPLHRRRGRDPISTDTIEVINSVPKR